MKKILLSTLLSLLSLPLLAQGMSDTQLLQFVQQEAQAGSSRSQIVTKLMQKGVKIDQIRRVYQQYGKLAQQRGLGSQAQAGLAEAESRMRTNNDERQPQDLTSAKVGTASEVYREADMEYAEIQQAVNTKEADVVEQIDGKKVFGRDIFNSKVLSFEPNMNIATPQDYVLGPGDELIIDIYGASQKTEQLTVSPDGTVTVPGYGPIAVSGLTVAAAQRKVRSSLGSRYASSELRLTVGQTRTITVNVMGEVRVPGSYTLSAFATVFHALYMAGGISDLGTLRNIRVYRRGRLVTVVDVYDYILNGRLAGNVRLQAEDVIQVGPYDCLVGVTGNVKRPMFYEMRPTESVATLLEYAGGFTGDAYRKSVRLVRKSGERYAVYNVNEFDLASFRVSDGDAVSVDGILNRYEDMAEVRGAVFRPGQYRLGGTVTTVRSLLEAAEGVTEEAFTAHAVLHRLKADRTLETVPVDVRGILDGTVADIPLQNEDVLFVPTTADRVSERVLTIGGEVMSPGTYEYADNTTIEDLVMQAGGLTDAASTVKVDVSRRLRDPKATSTDGRLSETYEFQLRDGMVIDGTPGFTLQPYDEVQVRRSPGYKEPRAVFVEGEVVFDGSYTLSTKGQRLSELVKAAGGLTPDAYAKGARLVRRLNDEERARLQSAIETARRSQTARDSVSLDMLETADTYPVGIQLDKALANPGSNYDLVLRKGDRLIVPEYNGTVKISGDVLYPNTVAYDTSRNKTKWYVKQAGGFGNRAKRSGRYVVYQNGTVAQGRRAKVEPGCEVIVPSKPEGKGVTLAEWLAVGTSVASLATMVATISNLVK